MKTALLLLPALALCPALSAESADAAAAARRGLAGKAVTTLLRFTPRQTPSAEDGSSSWKASAWRGERVNGQIVTWSAEERKGLKIKAQPLHGPGKATLPVRASFVRATKAKNELLPDIIDDSNQTRDLPAGESATVWLAIDVPANAPAGTYRGEVTVSPRGGASFRCPVELQVLPATLPPPEEWSFHLDLWQYPEAVARWHQVPAWSPRHFALLKPLMQRLAAAGQKAITCTIIDEAWNGQTYDKCPSMVEWRRKSNGTMSYDYKVFDQWVEFMTKEVGMKGQISCYTMLPWSKAVRVFDEKSGQYEKIAVKPGTPEYEKLWGHFLDDFRAHVTRKGWLERICIGMDERPDGQVKALLGVLKAHAPEFRIASAVNAPTGTSSSIEDLSVVLPHAGSVLSGVLDKRRAAGQKTTVYVCCGPAKPNTFTASPPAEGAWLGIYAAARKFDGVLRWAYNAWNADPFARTDFGNWPAGDCFVVYPGNLTSIRFEKFRDGIEEYEKIRLLRERAAKPGARPGLVGAVEQMEEVLQQAASGNPAGEADYRGKVERSLEAVEKASRVAGN